MNALGQFFGGIYCLFEDFFGLDLADYLWGQASPYSTSNKFIGVGLWLLLLTLAFVLVYYYALRQARRPWTSVWGWLIFMAANAVTQFFVGYWWVVDDYYKDLMRKPDPVTGVDVALPIGPSNLLCFGVSQVLLSVVAFVLLSLACKWGSRYYSRIPF